MEFEMPSRYPGITVGQEQLLLETRRIEITRNGIASAKGDSHVVVCEGREHLVRILGKAHNPRWYGGRVFTYSYELLGE
jgi:hypothetical protein